MDPLAKIPETAPVMPMPAPERELRVEGVTIFPPGESKPTETGLAFAIQAGSALGVIGASGSGKSTLSRATVGAWPRPPERFASTAQASTNGTGKRWAVILDICRKAKAPAHRPSAGLVWVARWSAPYPTMQTVAVRAGLRSCCFAAKRRLR
uniref:Probable rhizobicin secretion protein n=1 Tax=Rhizobium loti TaxID=381 RepID=M5AL68_RHILI|nr:probable rhizobicin secretion protein [Mesorhizobium loti NZP2037]